MQRRKRAERFSIFNQLFHLLAFSLKKPKLQLECGTVITSIDIDVGSKTVGVINQSRNDVNIHEYLTEYQVGEIEEKTTPLLLQFFNDLKIPVTFAIRGQLTEIESDVLKSILKSPVHHDIGAHGYYHKTFTSITEAGALNELKRISQRFSIFGVKPESFVFPRNAIAHLHLLEKFGYKCYRGNGGLTKDGMYIKKEGKLYDIHPSFHLGTTYNPVFLTNIINIAAQNKLPFHLWFHPRDLYETRGSTQRSISKVLSPLYEYAKKKEKEGKLKFETMSSIVEKLKPTFLEQ